MNTENRTFRLRITKNKHGVPAAFIGEGDHELSVTRAPDNCIKAVEEMAGAIDYEKNRQQANREDSKGAMDRVKKRPMLSVPPELNDGSARGIYDPDSAQSMAALGEIITIVADESDVQMANLEINIVMMSESEIEAIPEG